ncbi:Similar to ninaC: Neither inactivation nor afterpotential protein C (Drosophila melanogaster) [Cotesia congregata]|uniref:Similar to ninaC: Neither inactivation nor afterpotential protein C (Drosophila melanogaster) n=1 Tax=Cotesia congregata TaxID=51543 RepID=A0A8J2EHR6_COTCN|nr:Similar to ninaC: Neither inactivation nor afterpotential protein C (Drosophila melanogaster) [Cotesia congregata]
MHCVGLGVCRQFANLLFDTKNHAEKFYLGHFIKEVDSLLLSIHSTSEFSRPPRVMSDRAHFKAHEWIIFLLAYSLPVFQKFMKKEYFEHWTLLVDGISILVKQSIAKSEIIYARQCLISFINGVETLYGKKHVSYNVHQLAHLPESVENWGPLFTHSAFIYEDFYQTIQNYVKSANGVSIQICDAFRLKCVIDRLLIICDKDLNFNQREYLNNVLKLNLN